jgi:hypothetical protein
LRKNYDKVVSVSMMQQHYIKNLTLANQELKARVKNYELVQQMPMFAVAAPSVEI